MDYLFFDLETTGTSAIKDKIVSLSCFKTKEDLIPFDQKNILINPGIPIPKEASDIHGITDEMVKDKPLFSAYANNIFNYFKNCIYGGYNSNKYDLVLLSEEFGRCKIVFPETLDYKTIDSYKIFLEKEKRTLTYALDFYTGEKMEGAHDAQNDVLATLKILKGQMSKYGMSLEECIEMCKDKDKLDIEGKIVLKDGVACFSFGKHKDKPVKENLDYAVWMLDGEFSTNTKNILKLIINEK